MAITSIVRDLLSNYIVRVTAANTLAEVATAGYVTAQIPTTTALNHGLWEWQVGDLVDIAASDGNQMFEFSGSDFTSFITLPGGNGAVTLPVVDGDFTVFDGTLGALKDSGFLPSNAAKTRVVMAGSATVANHIALFQDTTGTIDDTAATALNNGPIQAGLSGTSGYLASYPAAVTSGSLRLVGVANGGDFTVAISNASHGQATTYSIADVGAATGQLLNKTAAFVSGNLIAASGTAGITVDAGAPSSGLFQVASVAITAAQWNGMYAAPKLLVAAPGANNIIVIDRAVLIMTFVSAAYAAGGVVGLQYDNTVHGAGVAASNTEAAADFAAGASTVFQFNGVAGNTVAIAPFTTSVNKGLYISNLTGAFTTGDSTFVMKVYYRIIAVV